MLGRRLHGTRAANVGFQRLTYCCDLGEVTPTPEWFLGLMMTQVVPVVVLFMVAGAALGLIVKAMRTAARRAMSGGRSTRR